MKTLKQIREEYNAKFLDRLDSAPDELMLEGRESGKKISRASPIPSSKEMPVMLIFRRMQYKVFPNNQVVALYYSNMVNKYLSIPFGKDGNLNLSEAVISDTIDEGVLDSLSNIASTVSKGVGTAIDAAKTVGKFIAKPLGSNPNKLGQNKPTPSGVKGKTSWDKAKPRYNATAQSKLAQSDLAQAKNTSQRQVAENKISDIRAMISSGDSLHEMTINGISITLNNSMAKRILEVYDSVNTKNKKIVESMLNEDLESFKKLLNFSIRN
jgi:hypothetical protein